MEKPKQHIHGKASHHRPLDAYQLYELEHKLHFFDKLPSLPPPPKPVEPVKQINFWNKPSPRYGGGTGAIPVYEEEEDINDDAGEFVAAERSKFKLNRWISSSEEGSERFPDLLDSRDPDAWTCMYGPCNYQWSGYHPHY